MAFECCIALHYSGVRARTGKGSGSTRMILNDISCLIDLDKSSEHASASQKHMKVLRTKEKKVV